MLNLLTFHYIVKIYFIVWGVKGEDPDPEPDPWDQIITDPGPNPEIKQFRIQADPDQEQWETGGEGGVWGEKIKKQHSEPKLCLDTLKWETFRARQ